MVINVFGKRGSGKTTLIKGNLRDFHRPVFIIDVLGNFDDPNFYHASSIPDAINHAREKLQDPKSDCVVCLKTGDPSLAADYFSSAIWKIGSGRQGPDGKPMGGTLVLDEVDSIRMKEGSCFDEYIRYGRNRGGDLITGCRRPAELDKNITAAANKFYCFGTHEPRDLEYFEAAVFGEYAYELANVPKYSGIFINFDKNIRGKFRIDILGNVFHTEEHSLD